MPANSSLTLLAYCQNTTGYGFAPASLLRTDDGKVTLDGVLLFNTTPPQNSVIAKVDDVLARPKRDLILNAWFGSGAPSSVGRIDLRADGYLVFQSSAVAPPFYVSLGGISYPSNSLVP